MVARGSGTDGEVGRAGVRRVQRELCGGSGTSLPLCLRHALGRSVPAVERPALASLRAPNKLVATQNPDLVDAHGQGVRVPALGVPEEIAVSCGVRAALGRKGSGDAVSISDCAWDEADFIGAAFVRGVAQLHTSGDDWLAEAAYC